MTRKTADLEKETGISNQTMRGAARTVATHLLQVRQRGLVISALLKVVLGRFDDPIDDLGIDASLCVVVDG